MHDHKDPEVRFTKTVTDLGSDFGCCLVGGGLSKFEQGNNLGHLHVRVSNLKCSINLEPPTLLNVANEGSKKAFFVLESNYQARIPISCGLSIIAVMV